MNNFMTIVKKELSRFFGDKRLIFTTLIMPGLMIYLMYTLMGQGMMKQFNTSEGYIAKAYIVNAPVELAEEIGKLPVTWEDWDGAEDAGTEILEKVEAGEVDGILVFPENFSKVIEEYRVGNGEAPNVEIYHNSEKTNSESFYSIVKTFLNAYEESISNRFDINKADGKYGEYDLASELGIMGKVISGLLPMLIMIFIFSGCQGVAPESIAGEKERGTIATLLVTPMKRSALALGKIVSLSIIALLAGLSSFLGAILSLPKMMGNQVDFSASSYTAWDYGMLLMVIVSTVLVMVAIISLISAGAKSVKEATISMTPLMMAVMVISLLPMFGVDFGGNIAFCIPMYNSVRAMTGIFGFQRNNVMCVATVLLNLATAGVLTGVLTRMFNSEKIMFNK
ncbi:MAG: ABC transporter permease [Lachnospiraceae bacterium]|nr:ABC transporter permease [Lachnospiraceae bacterium]